MSASTAIAPGTRFGKYTLVRQLAVGGMAEIYLARADGIGQFAKQLVLKRILPQHATDEVFVEMFLHEARLAARLQHPNVVQVFDIGENDGSYFFTMEYVHGDDVRSLLGALRKRGEQLPIDHVIAIGIGAAAGLHHAHEQVDDDGRPLDMVHRDISPSNLMLSFDGAVKVTDFGIAKTSGQVVQTKSGVLKGKIAYMSPEQCKGDPLDRRSDIFALGSVLHELVTGRKLFRAENEYAILRQIIETDAPRLASTAEREVPAALDAIIARALTRDRDARYPTAQALQLDLESFAREHRLDTSSVSLAAYVRERITPRPAASAPDADALTPATTPIPGPPTSSTVVEPRSTSTSNLVGQVHDATATRTRKGWIVGASVSLVAALGLGVAMFVQRGDGRTTPSTAPAGSSGADSVTSGASPGAVTSSAATTSPTASGSAATTSPTASGSAATASGSAATTSPTASGSAATSAAGSAAGTSAAGSAGSGSRPTRPTTRPPRPPRTGSATTPTPTDPCAGWNPNSLAPPPPGCDPK